MDEPVEPPLLLPDLTTLPATGLLIEGTGPARLLRFGTTLVNLGTGPLVAAPDTATVVSAGAALVRPGVAPRRRPGRPLPPAA